MWTILQRDFKSYFRSQMAYFLLPIYLILSMVAAFYSGYFFELNNSDLYSFFTFQPEILATIIPAVTMRLWAEERRQGTLEFILTQPLQYSSVVLGKFGAAVSFCMVILATSLPFVIYANFYINIDNLNVLSAYFGCTLIILSFVSIGCLVSSFSKNTVMAYLISVFIEWGFLGVNFNSFISSILSSFGFNITANDLNLNLVGNYQTIINGQIGVDNLLYFLSFIILSLWFNLFAVEYKKD